MISYRGKHKLRQQKHLALLYAHMQQCLTRSCTRGSLVLFVAEQTHLILYNYIARVLSIGRLFLCNHAQG